MTPLLLQKCSCDFDDHGQNWVVTHEQDPLKSMLYRINVAQNCVSLLQGQSSVKISKWHVKVSENYFRTLVSKQLTYFLLHVWCFIQFFIYLKFSFFLFYLGITNKPKSLESKHNPARHLRH